MEATRDEGATSLFPISSEARSSLFPISEYQEEAFPPTQVPGESRNWLSNRSFSEAVLPPRPPSEENAAAQTSDSDNSEEERERRKRKKSREDRRHRKKHKRREAKESAEDNIIGSLKGKTHRKANADHWSTETSHQKPYFFDSYGDRDNLAFGSLFRQDVPRYYSYQSKEILSEGVTWKNRVDFLTPEGDSLAQDDELKAGGRYWSAKVASLERRQDYKRIRIVSDHSKQQALTGDFIPLEVEPGVSVKPRDESWEDYVLRKTRDFSQLTHEQPRNKDAWLSFAGFQEELIQAAQKKALRLHAIDKKIHLLEKALELYPEDESLILLHLETLKRREDVPALVSRWEQTIAKLSGSYRLWREYLNLCRSTFSSFSVSSLRKLYSQALQALIAARNRQLKDEYKPWDSAPASSKLVEAEIAALSLFCDLCRFEWQNGHQELGIGLFQAQFEYSLLCPSIQLSATNKLRLFEAFWNSGAPRIGEPGAVGWRSWMEHQEEELQKANAVANRKEEEDSVWKGWDTSRKSSDPPAEAQKQDGEADDTVEDNKHDDVIDEEDDAALLEKLGLNLDTKEVEVKNSHIWKLWSEEETRRDLAQWLPVKSSSAKLRAASDGDNNMLDEDEELQKMVLFDDIREFLFSLWTEEARRYFVGQFSDFCNAPLFQWCCSNNRGYKEEVDCMDVLKTKFLAGTFEDRNLEFLVPAVDWIKESQGRGHFVRNAFLLVKDFMKHKLQFQEVLLSLEAMEASTTASRALAKSLLKSNRQLNHQDLTLWAAYASFEASTGDLETARKVFDNALTSLNALPTEAQLDAPILYFAYAEVEMAHCAAAGVDSGERVLYILYFLGTGETFKAASSDTLSRTQLLKGRRSFGDQLQKLRHSCQGEDLSERGACLVICAALFEQLTAGWQSAARIFEDILAVATPDTKRQNIHYERLHVCYISMLESQKSLIKPTHIREVVKQAVLLYPFNLKLLNFYVNISPANEARRLIDEVAKSHPSSMHWLYTLSWELSKPGTGSHIHSLFERALEAGGSLCPLLWRCYISFELKANKPDKARRVFFRAIHACPWSKALWMDAFDKLSSILSVKELSDLVDIMRDKELRIRTDVYEILLQEVENS